MSVIRSQKKTLEILCGKNRKEYPDQNAIN